MRVVFYNTDVNIDHDPRVILQMDDGRYLELAFAYEEGSLFAYVGTQLTPCTHHPGDWHDLEDSSPDHYAEHPRNQLLDCGGPILVLADSECYAPLDEKLALPTREIAMQHWKKCMDDPDAWVISIVL